MAQSINTVSKLIEINGAMISYTDSGKGTVPLIFIHGFPFDHSTWQEQAVFFSKTQRVITYDIRGFGYSTAGQLTTFSIELFADDLIRLMDALHIRHAVLCGLSMGGYIALNVINRYPERIKALILCDTQCIADSEEAKEKRYKTIEQIESEGLVNFTENFIKNIFYKDSLESQQDTVDHIRRVMLSTPAHVVTATLKALAERAESCTTLKDIRVPVLIICGEEDVVTPLRQSEFMKTNIPNASLHTIPAAGHLSNVEQGEEFNKRLMLFLKETA